MKVERLRRKLMLANKRIEEIKKDDFVVSVERDEIFVNKYIKYFVNVTLKDGRVINVQLDLRDEKPEAQPPKAEKPKVKTSALGFGGNDADKLSAVIIQMLKDIGIRR